MADAAPHNPAELHPEDAPSEVHPFDEDPDGGSERGGHDNGSEGERSRGTFDDDSDVEPEHAPSEVQPFDEEPARGRSPPRGRDAGGPNRPRGRSPEDDGLEPEDAPSEVQPFDEEPGERAPPPRHQAAGRQPPPRNRQPPPRNRQPSPRRGSRGRAQNPPERGPGGRVRNPRIRDGVEEDARPRPRTEHEKREERRRKRDRHGAAARRTPTYVDEFLLPFSEHALHWRAVERIRRKLYRVSRERIREPVRENKYRWHVPGYVREHAGEPEKRRVIVEGGPEIIDVLFDESTPNSNIETWIAEKLVEIKGRGPRAPSPSEMREPIYDNGVCCSILSQSTISSSLESADNTNTNLKSTSSSVPSDGETLMQSSKPRLRLRGGAGSPTGASEHSASPLQPFDITSEEDNAEDDRSNRIKGKGKGKQRELSLSPIQSSEDNSDDDDLPPSGSSRRRPARRRRPKTNVRPGSSSDRSRRIEPRSLSDSDSDDDHQAHAGPSRSQSRSRPRSRRQDVYPRSSSRRSRRTVARSPVEDDSPIPDADETLVEESTPKTLRNRPSNRPPIRGDPYRLRRVQARPKARHEEARAKLSDPDKIVIEIERHGQGKHRTRVHIVGEADHFRTREIDNDMSSEEIKAHVLAAYHHSWRPIGRRPRSPSPLSPGCRCVIL